jgi:hypothetical protein
MSCFTRARPKPRDEPVMRYVAIFCLDLEY